MIITSICFIPVNYYDLMNNIFSPTKNIITNYFIIYLNCSDYLRNGIYILYFEISILR